MSAGSVYARDWRAVRRLTEREAVARGYAHLWRDAARQAAGAGRPEYAEECKGRARRAAAKAAAYRARIMNRCDGNGGRD